MKDSTPSSPAATKAPSKHESKYAQDIRNLAEYISSEKCTNVVLMLGAGLYSNLARLNLPHPEAVFEINFFRRNPVPFYTLASELYPGAFRPTPTHSFIKLLATHGLLHTCFTQNIDTLERRAGVPADKIVEAHGSFAAQRCIDCKRPYPDDAMRECVLGPKKEGEGVRIPRCERKGCGGLVKPDIVFFGEALPDRFITHILHVGNADLLLIIGTSLTVQPFASLAGMADRRTCRRVLINLEQVGDLGRRPGDVVLLGECDTIVRALCEELGWGEELERVWGESAMKEDVEGKGETELDEDELLEKELEMITKNIRERMGPKEEEQSERATTSQSSESERNVESNPKADLDYSSTTPVNVDVNEDKGNDKPPATKDSDVDGKL